MSCLMPSCLFSNGLEKKNVRHADSNRLSPAYDKESGRGKSASMNGGLLFIVPTSSSHLDQVLTYIYIAYKTSEVHVIFIREKPKDRRRQNELRIKSVE